MHHSPPRRAASSPLHQCRSPEFVLRASHGGTAATGRWAVAPLRHKAIVAGVEAVEGGRAGEEGEGNGVGEVGIAAAGKGGMGGVRE